MTKFGRKDKVRALRGSDDITEGQNHYDHLALRSYLLEDQMWNNVVTFVMEMEREASPPLFIFTGESTRRKRVDLEVKAPKICLGGLLTV